MKKFSAMITCCLIAFLAGSTSFAQKTAEDFYKVSEKRLMNRDLEGALVALDKAIEIRPDLPGLYLKRSELLLMKGQPDAALANLDKSLVVDPEFTPAYVRRGSVRMMNSDMKGALNDFDNAIVRGDRSVYGLRANLRLMLGDPTGALSDFNAAISMNPNRVRNYLGRAATRNMMGDEVGALADYSYVIDAFEEKERDGTAPDEATRKVRGNDMRSPVISGPARPKAGDSTVTTKTELIVTMNPEAEATMTAEEMEYLPNVAGAYVNRSQIRSRKGDFEAALGDLNKSIAIYPHFGAYDMRGELWQKRGDLKAALADFNKSIEIQPGRALAYLHRGETLMLMGKDAEAEKDFSHSLELDPRMETMVANRRAAAKKQREEKP